ncbi:hypothetical protein PHYBLDRAFT_148038 [Phycomyces blakesleeanus NRRL 1555(-)]|uniref:Uncharacterized protein n=1 Tax=Phycomyces blakesleeanus (strain ATCC 8743b / DSM 1359 / FGSC 10004 / NBRC 33097 / NRRL 1555) TaxID=763407 RepID=A0A167LNW3_PHYB8|nr:hypothetical protein PHYBLDRAFT_148038 [Phycomyces blakesleeanus NRRL 1555(-)]OAD70817.1 hypothetical protein PHYBLDRAFT_148038 [Phycomyces blakesleeanus NRRL 1555(-)]|eukprot:XP_018288857.1 hypothetical protein PHYBLDRAFT_148038 [Phycomyces blakesleeanus NRRL 1555(-)]
MSNSLIMHRFILLVTIVLAMILVTQAVEARSLKHQVKKYGKKLSKQAPDLLEQYTGQGKKGGHKDKKHKKHH